MEVLLNAAGLTPVSLHKPPPINSSEPKTRLPSLKVPKFSTSHVRPDGLRQSLSRGFCGGLAVVSAVLNLNNGGLAKALTYEEALDQSMSNSSFSFGDSTSIDISGVLDGIVSFGTENPLIVGGGAAVLVVPIILSQVLKKPKPWGVESAKIAYSKLSEDADAQLLDIREGKEFKEVGAPDIRSLKKKAVSITYRGDDKLGFLKKLSLRFKDPENTTLFILDKFDGNSELVAELATLNSFKAAFAIKDGAEGTRGWMNSGLPWSPPKKTLNVDFDDLKDAITSALGEGNYGLPVTFGVAAATGLGLLAFSEMETVLQLLGSAALVQFVTKKLLFAEDRKVTLKQVDEFLNTKVAPKELVDEIKMIGKALLPASTNVKASLPAPSETSTTASSAALVQEADDVHKANVEQKVEAAAEPPREVNSVPRADVSSKSLSGLSRPLSPYPYYPDFKPPSSPSPSQP